MSSTGKSASPNRRRRNVNVTFKTSPDVIKMLDQMGIREDRTRSDVIDQILRGALAPDPIPESEG